MKTVGTPRGTQAYASTHRRMRRWLTVVACMAALVVFGTVYALVMPAATLEGETYCGMEEHTHDDSCYASVLACGQEEGNGHVHDDSCYETQLVCQLPEHTHTDACYAAPAGGEAAAEVTASGERVETDAPTEADEPAETAEAAALPDGAQVPEGYTRQYTVRDEEHGFAVTVYAPEGVVPEGAVLSAALLQEGDEAYAQAEQALAGEAAQDAAARSEDGQAAETDYGFAALDIHFADAAGNEVEPNGDVYVVIDADGLLPEDVDPASVTVQHHAQQDDGQVTLETVADAADATEGVVAVEEKAISAAFPVDSFSHFTVTWKYYNDQGATQASTQFAVYCYDVADGEELPGDDTLANISVTDGETFVFEASNEALHIDGYTFDHAEYSVDAATEKLTTLTASRVDVGEWQYTVNHIRALTTAKPSISLYYTQEGVNEEHTIRYDQLNVESTNPGRDKVRFYVNLNSEIADSDSGHTGTRTENFTSAVHTTVLNKYPELFQYTPAGENGAQYAVIQGSSNGSAYEVDQEIRKLGTNGVSGFRISNFPSDEEVFDYLKKLPQSASSGQAVWKDITVGGHTITYVNRDTELNTENYTIRWYVFKYDTSDAWHVDGILVPKYGQLTVTKTFEFNTTGLDEEALKNLVPQDFTISVKGETTTNSLQNSYTLQMRQGTDTDDLGTPGWDSEQVDKEQGTVTYTWTVDVLNAEYTITENNADVEGYTSEGAKYTTTPYQGSKSSKADYNQSGIKITCVTTGADTATAQQSVALTNSYSRDTVNLTLTKTFDGLSNAEVNYLIFSQSNGGFGWDINYCQNEARDGEDNKLTFMVDVEAAVKQGNLPEIRLPDGTTVDGGGDFGFTAKQFLVCGGNGISAMPENGEYTNSLSGATLTKDEEGNWVFSVTLEVYKTDDTHFYTVFEQHQEVPGYAKINDSNAEWTITSENGTISLGTGKFIDNASKNIYESMSEIDTAADNEHTYDANNDGTAEKYAQSDEVCIAAGAFEQLQITGDTTISFTNHYQGDLDVTKELAPDSQAGNDNSLFTITLQPADESKLIGKDESNGLSGKSFSYEIVTVAEDGTETAITTEAKSTTLNSDGTYEFSLKPGQTIHFYDLPAIQWQVVEDTDADANAIRDYTLTVTYSDKNKGVVNDVLHWNGYTTGDRIGATEEDDGIASVDSATNSISGYAVDPSPSAVASVTVTNSYKHNPVDITVTKVDGNTIDTDDVTKLANAEFYLMNSDAKYYKYDPNAERTTWVDEENATQLTSSATEGESYGTFTMFGLPDDTYTLVETTAPNGYELPTSNVTFTVTNGVITATSGGPKSEELTLTVPNYAGDILPATGGIGTTCMTIGGLALMAGAVGCGFALRRRRGKGAK